MSPPGGIYMTVYSINFDEIWSHTVYEGLFRGVSDADEVSALVDTVSSSFCPRPHGQEVKQVTEVIKGVGHPGATLLIPSCNQHSTTLIYTHTSRDLNQS